MHQHFDEKAVELTKQLLELIGEDVNREGLQETPKRVAKMYKEIFSGYETDPSRVMKTFEVEHSDGMVVVADIPFYSMCEHHMLPFFGTMSIGYVPDKRVLGLSKFARVTDIVSKRLQVQEQMNSQIAELLMKHLKPKGVMVFSKATHMCMCMRGAAKYGSYTNVLTKKGVFLEDDKLVQEFLGQL